MIADEDEQASLPIFRISALKVAEDALDDPIHLFLLRPHKRAAEPLARQYLRAPVRESRRRAPARPTKMADMVETEVVQDKHVPVGGRRSRVVLLGLERGGEKRVEMARDVRVDRHGVLSGQSAVTTRRGILEDIVRTETKKLLTPSVQSNHALGNSRNHVSSPANTSFLSRVASCRTHESTRSRAALVTDSSTTLRIESRKFGFEPVVRAFRRGRVTVGACATAVYGRARPDSTRLRKKDKNRRCESVKSSKATFPQHARVHKGHVGIETERQVAGDVERVNTRVQALAEQVQARETETNALRASTTTKARRANAPEPSLGAGSCRRHVCA